MYRVEQSHKNGCFVACVAMLLGISYEEAFKKVFPKSKYPLRYYDWPKAGYKLTPEKSLQIMKRLGIKTKKAKLKNVMSLRNRTALIMLRWRQAPELMHGMVFDPDSGYLLDPHWSHTSIEVLNENLEAIYYVKRKQTCSEHSRCQ